MVRLQASSLNALSKTALLGIFAVESPHPVFDLVNRLFFAVKSLDSNQVPSVANEIALDA